MLTSIPILMIADLEECFMVCNYMSIEWISGVLLQEGNVIYYDMRKLKDHDKICEKHDMDLVAIVNMLKFWRHYVMGR